jgi:HSP20 family protein
MLLTRYEPWSAMRQIENEMSRMFDNAAAGAEDGSNGVTSRWTPAVDIEEDSERFVITADIPGVEPKDIEVTMENGVLTLKGERKLETQDEGDNGYRRVERVYGSFYRRFTLPDTADAEAISASGNHGVLEVVIPKRAALQPKRIAVSH